MTDYQLVEQEDGRGSQYRLFVSPEVTGADDGVRAAAFLEELGKLKVQYPFMVSLWSRAGVLRVVRRHRPSSGAPGRDRREGARGCAHTVDGGRRRLRRDAQGLRPPRRQKRRGGLRGSSRS